MCNSIDPLGVASRLYFARAPFAPLARDPLRELINYLSAGVAPEVGVLRNLIGRLDPNVVGQMLGAGGMPSPAPSIPAALPAEPSLAHLFPPNLATTFPNATAPNPQIPPADKKYNPGGWLAAHHYYKHVGDIIDLPDGKRAVPIIGRKHGEYNVIDKNGQSLGVWTSAVAKRKDAQTVTGVYTPPKTNTPLMFDVDGDGKVGTTNTQGGKRIDLDGDKKVDNAAWADKGDGVLAFGKGKTGLELIGNNSDVDGDGKGDGYANGFEAIASLAKKHLGAGVLADGKLDAVELAALEARADLHMIVDGKKKTLQEAGVKELDLGYIDAGSAEDLMGNEHRQQGSFSRTDGRKSKVDSVWVHTGRG